MKVVARSFHGRLLVLALTALGSTACATSRGIVDIRPGIGVEPLQGPAVSLASIEDRRRFEVAPRDASVPSLKDRKISDVSITSRAIARKRNTYGKALGDVLLPQGRQVQDVIREALTRSFHASGYRVVGPSAATREGVDPLQVEILEMWAWATPGFWAMHLECRIHVRVNGSRPPFLGGREFKGYVRLATQGATGRAWKNTIDKGLKSLMDDIEAQLSGSASRTVGDGR